MLEAKQYQDKSDEEIASIALSNQVFFGLIIERYQEKLQRYIGRLTNADQDDREDILQEVFIKVYKNLRDFDTDLKFSSWIYRITYNHVISSYRKTQSRPESASLEISDDFLNKLATDIDLVKEIDLEINNKYIKKALANIDAKYRDAIVLRFIEEKDYKEISDILKKPMGTVATLLNRAKVKLKLELKKEFKIYE